MSRNGSSNGDTGKADDQRESNEEQRSVEQIERDRRAGEDR